MPDPTVKERLTETQKSIDNDREERLEELEKEVEELKKRVSLLEIKTFSKAK